MVNCGFECGRGSSVVDRGFGVVECGFECGRGSSVVEGRVW